MPTIRTSRLAVVAAVLISSISLDLPVFVLPLLTLAMSQLAKVSAKAVALSVLVPSATTV